MNTESRHAGSRPISPAPAIIGGALAVVLSAIFFMMAWPPHWYVLLIIGLPLLGGVLALLRPTDWRVLVLSIALILFGSLQLLISGVGLLYLLPIVLLAVGAVAIGQQTGVGRWGDNSRSSGSA